MKPRPFTYHLIPAREPGAGFVVRRSDGETMRDGSSPSGHQIYWRTAEAAQAFAMYCREADDWHAQVEVCAVEVRRADPTLNGWLIAVQAEAMARVRMAERRRAA